MLLLCFVLGFSGCATVLLRFIAVLVLGLGLFEPFCHLKLLRAALGNARLVCNSSGVMGDHHCLLLLVCFCVWLPFLLEFSWFVVVLSGLVVGEPTPSLFVGFFTSSSFGIRSGNNSPL
jgi:hypothetical protein